MRTIEREIVAALIFSKDGKIFLGRKNQKSAGVYLDCWHLPGGGVDEGETEIDALKREIDEETGIDLNGSKITFALDNGEGLSKKTIKETGEKVYCKMHFLVYRVELPGLSEEVKVNLHDELVEYVWVASADLMKFKHTPPSIKLFERLNMI